MTALALALAALFLAAVGGKGGATVTNSSESPPPLTFPGGQGEWSGTAQVPIVWEEPEGVGVSSYSIEHFIDGKQQETTTVFYSTTYYMATVEMGESSNCFVVTAHTLNDTDVVVGQGCTGTTPSAPVALKVATVDHHSAVLVWGIPEYPGGQIISFHVYYNEHSLVVPFNITMATDLHFELIGLLPSTAYLVNVTAENAKGEGPPSDPILLQTTHPSHVDWRMYVAVAAVGGFLVGLVFAICVACAATASKAAAKAFRDQRDRKRRSLAEQEED